MPAEEGEKEEKGGEKRANSGFILIALQVPEEKKRGGRRRSPTIAPANLSLGAVR